MRCGKKELIAQGTLSPEQLQSPEIQWISPPSTCYTLSPSTHSSLSSPGCIHSSHPSQYHSYGEAHTYVLCPACLPLPLNHTAGRITCPVPCSPNHISTWPGALPTNTCFIFFLSSLPTFFNLNFRYTVEES